MVAPLETHPEGRLAAETRNSPRPRGPTGQLAAGRLPGGSSSPEITLSAAAPSRGGEAPVERPDAIWTLGSYVDDPGSRACTSCTPVVSRDVRMQSSGHKIRCASL